MRKEYAGTEMTADTISPRYDFALVLLLVRVLSASHRVREILQKFWSKQSTARRGRLASATRRV